MTDRELMQLAANAAGIELGWDAMGAYQVLAEDSSGGVRWTWNPLEDDGDALRLAVKLGMGMDASNHDYVWAGNDYSNQIGHVGSGVDLFAAARRAIVSAAAETEVCKNGPGAAS